MPEFKMSYENFFGAKTSVMLFISLESVKEAMKAHIIDMDSHGYPITEFKSDTCTWTPM